MRHAIKKSVIIPILLLAIVASSIYPVQTAFAATPSLYVRQSLIVDMRPSILGMALAECLANNSGLADGSWNFLGLSGRDQISESHAESGQWYGVPTANTPDNNAHVSYILPPNVGFTHCSDAGFISSAVKAVGFDSNIGALCGLDFGRINGSDCGPNGPNSNGSGGFKQLHHLSYDTYYGMIKTLGKAGDLTDPQLYLFYMDSMEIACNAKPSDTPGDAAYTWTADVVDSSGAIAYVNYIGTVKANDLRDARDIGGAPNLKGVTCSDMANRAKQYAKAYSLYVIRNKDVPDTTTPAAGATTDTATTPGATGGSTCGIGGIGWIVCPVLTFLGDINDNAFAFIANDFLQVDTGLVSGDAVVKTWDSFRNIANIAFVIVFMIIIFSQVTSIGVTNYGIKRMIPRLIITAVLVNMSLIVCQLAVDLSNVVGWSVGNLFNSIPIDQATGQPALGIVVSGEAVKWSAIVIASVAGVALLLAVSVPVLIAALLALLMIVLIIIGRQAIIVLLVILSPIAFVAYLLPNTENLFKKWYKLFYTMLLLFPIIGIVFAASKLAANIIASTPPSSGIDSNIIKVMALGVSVVPFFVVPGLLKGALDATGKLGTTISGLSSKANSRLQGKVKTDSRLGRGLAQAKAYRDSARTVRQTKALGHRINAPFAAVTGGIGYAKQARTRAESIANEEFEKEVKDNALGYSKRGSGDVLDEYKSGKMNEAQKAAAIEHIMAKGSFGERKALVESIDPNMSGALKKRISDGVYSKGDQAIYGAGIGSHIMAGSVGGEKGLREKTLANIEGKHVTAEHLVQGESSAKYLVDVAMGETEIDPATGKPEVDSVTGKPTGKKFGASVSGTGAAQGELRGAIAEAKSNTKTRPAATAGAFADQFGRV